VSLPSGPIAASVLFEAPPATPAPPDLISVAVSLYNYARFLPECLDSVAAQTHAPLELIVVDDVSTRDESVLVARNWLDAHAARFWRVLLLQHVRNQGLAQARNTAFARARGAAVFVLDADNIIYPRAIARLCEALEDHEAAAAYTQTEHFGDVPGIGPADLWDPAELARGNYIDAMALIRRDVWGAVGGYTHLEGGWEDFDFWCKLVEHGLHAVYVPEILCRYRVHGASMLRTEHRAQIEALRAQITLRHPWLHLT
jgi:glycosyltransferase involved in cell wall biosynthesis